MAKETVAFKDMEPMSLVLTCRVKRTSMVESLELAKSCMFKNWRPME